MDNVDKSHGQFAGFKDFLAEQEQFDLLEKIREEPTYLDSHQALEGQDQSILAKLWELYLNPIEGLSQKDYELCLAVQDAVNLSGVVQTFCNLISKIWAETDTTADVNRHPICVLFADKIAQLAGVQGITNETMDRYNAAYSLVKKGAGKEESQ